MLEKRFTKAESDALALISAAKAMAYAYDKGNEAELVQALDDNLTVWVAIKTIALDRQHSLAQETKNNLIKLSDFVTARTLKMAQNVDQKTLMTFVNNNLLIADGLLANAQLSPAEEDAFDLVTAAVNLSTAKDNGNDAEITQALEENLQLWVAIKTMVKRKKDMPETVRENIVKMADFVVASTLQMGTKLDMRKVDTLINVNLQIAEGLLSGRKMNQAEEDAFALLNAAIKLSNAKDSKKDNDLIDALEENIAIWVSIRSAVGSKGKSGFAREIRDNLLKLSDFVVGKSIEVGRDLNFKSIDTLINANLQICEGLLERAGGAKTAADAAKKKPVKAKPAPVKAAAKPAAKPVAKKPAAAKAPAKKAPAKKK